ncbi:DUF4477 domain-containing protein [Mycena sanguinolenta]|uniref:DUF4477 domain-containing protein n=1 Tax=Mycena sanguinolenta TaxID=230812 RepID=A0A8H7D945_9AGAR|nr:DUF4477 domain-containing protein [Mycena sanguinolenta]
MVDKRRDQCDAPQQRFEHELDMNLNMARRCRQPPRLSRSPKNSLDATLHSEIDASLKQLKSCARSLQPVLSTFTDELQILHRIHYKGKNQHRSALFWRRVAEMRRYGDRLEELSLLSLVDSLRYSFFAEESQQNSKLLKGSWTRYPDPSSLSYTHERIAASIALVQKMHERLTHAYQTFCLAMQTGAFIQLVLALAGIASRMSTLAAELIPLLEQVQEVVRCILSTLNVTPPQTELRNDPRSRQMPDQYSGMVASVQEVSTDVEEDTGISMQRQVPRQELRPNHSVDAPVTPNTARIPSDISAPTVKVTKVKRAPLPAVEVVTKRTLLGSDPKPKKRRKRDEIDDIFG